MAVTKKNPTAVLETAINTWMGVHVQMCALVKKLEPKLDAAKARVIELLRANNLESFASKYGNVSLRKKTTTDWEGLARSLLTPSVIDAALPQWRKESEAFVVAPQSWAGKA
jgi:hypothetical protein